MNYSLTGEVVPIGDIYAGYLHSGDRVATEAEINAHTLSQAPAIKWAQYSEYCGALTVTTTSGNKFAVDAESLKNVIFKHNAILDGVPVLWVEDWGTFNTDKVELQEVIVRASDLMQTKIVELFGGV